MPLTQCEECGQEAWRCDKCKTRINRPQPFYVSPPYGSLDTRSPKVLCDKCYADFVTSTWLWFGEDPAPWLAQVAQMNTAEKGQ